MTVTLTETGRLTDGGIVTTTETIARGGTILGTGCAPGAKERLIPIPVAGAMTAVRALRRLQTARQLPVMRLLSTSLPQHRLKLTRRLSDSPDLRRGRRAGRTRRAKRMRLIQVRLGISSLRWTRSPCLHRPLLRPPLRRLPWPHPLSRLLEPHRQLRRRRHVEPHRRLCLIQANLTQRRLPKSLRRHSSNPTRTVFWACLTAVLKRVLLLLRRPPKLPHCPPIEET